MRELEYLESVLLSIHAREKIEEKHFSVVKCDQKMSIRDAMLSKKELVPVDKSLGRIFASPTLSCPPAVSVIVCGEEINKSAIELLKQLGTNEVLVTKE